MFDGGLTAIINPPDSAILAIGPSAKAPAADDDKRSGSAAA